MAEELLDQVRDLVDGVIVRLSIPSSLCSQSNNWLTCFQTQDFEGQRRAEVIATLLLAVSGV